MKSIIRRNHRVCNLITNKKGQIAETLTWVAAFLVIFFVMLIFIGGAAVLSGNKKVTSASLITIGGKNDNLGGERGIPTGYDAGDLDLQRELGTFLRMSVNAGGDKVEIWNLISNAGNWNIVSASAHELFDPVYQGCYVICFGNGQIITGANCKTGQYDCLVSKSEISGGFSYAEIGGTKMIIGGINPK